MHNEERQREGLGTRVKNLICYLVLIGLAGISLWCFYSIWRYGGITWLEPNRAMLALEIGTCIALIALGMERLIKLNRNL
ncbi:MAG: hypothetical protein KAI09_02170 [Dehalococcoidales bacterium]|jgi:hypothetical protein|nr:hypothetical protein [Dehalococcoidales bacterium]